MTADGPRSGTGGLRECFADTRMVSLEALRDLQKKANGPGVARLLAQGTG